MENFFISVENILTDESFLSWFYHPTPEKDQEWNNWLAAHPDQKPLIDEALAILSVLNIKEHHVPSSAVETAWQHLDVSISNSNNEKTPIFQINPSRRWWR